MSVTAPVEPDDTTAGFTLLEVLVALAVLAISLMSIGSLVAANMRSTRALQDHVALVSIARAIEAGLPEPAQRVDGPLTGTTRGHAWRVDYRPFFGGDAPRHGSSWHPEQVTITVTAPDGARFRFGTVRLQRNAAR